MSYLKLKKATIQAGATRQEADKCLGRCHLGDVTRALISNKRTPNLRYQLEQLYLRYRFGDDKHHAQHINEFLKS